MSNAQKVFEFTRDTGASISTTLKPLSQKEVSFIVRMVTSELIELAQTQYSNAEAQDLVRNAVTTDFNYEYVTKTDALEIAAEQADAAIDIMYYLYNAFAKKNINLQSVFDVVHEANMAKRGPTGEFMIRDDGKVVKPVNWQEPDIIAVMTFQSVCSEFIG